MKRICLLLFIITHTQFQFFAQNKTGNIVEYFGKEKINDISEGRLLHVFDKGLVLSNQNGNGSSTFPENPVVNEFLIDPNKQVEEGKSFDVNDQGEAMKWEAIFTDSTSTFSDRKLRSGYLYLEYNSQREETVLFEGSGQTQVLINGLPHEGDHYDFGYSLIPITLKKGLNTFLLTPGRFSRMRARLILPSDELMLTGRDMTLPDLLLEDQKEYLGAVRVINSGEKTAKNYSIRSNLEGKTIETLVRTISPKRVVKLPFQIPSLNADIGSKSLTIELLNAQGKVLSTVNTEIQLRSDTTHHKRTFKSNIDGSVQYFSVAPSTNQIDQNQALFLSVHGASVEAVNQANAYKKKNWGTLIAPTNRRPFGFAWEDWGRIDALEVLAEAKKIYNPDEQKIYLTGHSMGGHGTWYLGATYPGQFAAIAPCAGYPDLLSYRDSFRRRLQNDPELAKRMGISEERLARMLQEEIPTKMENMIDRAGFPSRTLKLKRNYLQQGVYILHGEDDNVVPTFIAREMREELGKFHPDFTYYEYPDGTHWYGDHSVDWPPIFDFFRQRTIPKPQEIDDFEFYTASPGVSSKSHFIEIHQQEKVFEISDVRVEREDSLFQILTNNIAVFSIDVEKLGSLPEVFQIDEQRIQFPTNIEKAFFGKSDNQWQLADALPLNEKGPHRYGGFKDAFNNQVVFVYATGGDQKTQDWYYNRAVFDAEKFWYRANGDIPVIKDIDFKPKDYKGRNVVLYGNRDNNGAWEVLLGHSPVQFRDGIVEFGEIELKGNQWGSYFIYPKKDDDKASIGVVTATGYPGALAAFDNNYLQNGTKFPDFLLFDPSVLSDGTDGVKCAGFFGNDWSVESGEFIWK